MVKFQADFPLLWKANSRISRPFSQSPNRLTVARFVINEWLWADSSGVNGKDAQQQTFEAIRKLAISEHQIVVIEGSAFDQKSWALCKSNDMVVRDLVKIFLLSVRLNSDRC